MTTTLLDGHVKWEGERDDEWHRTYKVWHIVEADYEDGPANVMQTAGLPVPGAAWSFDSDTDAIAFCYPSIKVTLHKHKEGEKHRYWLTEQTFSTKPLNNCADEQIDDPLDEPQKVSGSFVKYTEEAIQDRFGNPINNSAHELFRGPQVEFDKDRPQVVIEQNVADLELDLLAQMSNTVNDSTLWGLPARCVKLSEPTWEKKYYGQCNAYYTRRLTFDVNYDTFDRDLLDEGTKVLSGHWATDAEVDGSGTDYDPDNNGWILNNINGRPPNPDNPAHFQRFKDRPGENCRVILNGFGEPADVDIGTGTGSAGLPPAYRHVEKYNESNMFLLGIPASL